MGSQPLCKWNKLSVRWWGEWGRTLLASNLTFDMGTVSSLEAERDSLQQPLAISEECAQQSTNQTQHVE